MPVCVLGRENHPLAGYRLVLLPFLSPVHLGCGIEGQGGGGILAHLLAPLPVVVGVVSAWFSGPRRQGRGAQR